MKTLKKLLFFFASVTILAAFPASGVSSAEVQGIQNLFKPDEQKVVREQSFFTNLEGFGNVFFVTVENLKRPAGTVPCSFYLVKDGKIIYRFSDIEEIRNLTVYEYKAVSFKDMNSDGRKDVTVILDALTGIGPTGAVPFKAPAIYFNTGKGFKTDSAINQKLQDKQLQNISEIYRFMKSGGDKN